MSENGSRRTMAGSQFRDKKRTIDPTLIALPAYPAIELADPFLLVKFDSDRFLMVAKKALEGGG